MDRNFAVFAKVCKNAASLSARRAWIEISINGSSYRLRNVALRKESVDRNFLAFMISGLISSSLSARRAWIEICFHLNLGIKIRRRSPQGERG